MFNRSYNLNNSRIVSIITILLTCICLHIGFNVSGYYNSLTSLSFYKYIINLILLLTVMFIYHEYLYHTFVCYSLDARPKGIIYPLNEFNTYYKKNHIFSYHQMLYIFLTLIMLPVIYFELLLFLTLAILHQIVHFDSNYFNEKDTQYPILIVWLRNNFGNNVTYMFKNNLEGLDLSLITNTDLDNIFSNNTRLVKLKIGYEKIEKNEDNLDRSELSSLEYKLDLKLKEEILNTLHNHTIIKDKEEESRNIKKELLGELNEK